MKVVIAGGSGQVGTVLARAMRADGHEVVVLSRAPRQQPWRVVAWDGRTLGAWGEELNGADVVINLAGRSVNCRYGTANRRDILESRINATNVIGQALRSIDIAPKVWLQASTATIYAHRYDAPNDEATGVIGGAELNAPSTWRFSIDVANAWEKAAVEASLPRTRQVLMRSAMTMSLDRGGIFDTLLRLVRFGLGGTSGDGRQFVSWIHETDFVRAIYWLIERDDMSGVVNIASPHPLPNAEFMRILRAAWGVPIGLPATKWMLELGAIALATETELILKSRRVVPGWLLRSGFKFRLTSWDEAVFDLCDRWRRQHGSFSRTQHAGVLQSRPIVPSS